MKKNIIIVNLENIQIIQSFSTKNIDRKSGQMCELFTKKSKVHLHTFYEFSLDAPNTNQSLAVELFHDYSLFLSEDLVLINNHFFLLYK